MKTNGIRWCSWKNGWIFSRGLYSMYVVLQGIGFLPCIRLYIIYVIPFGEQPWMPAVPKLESFNQKTGPPKWSISLNIVSKKWVFQAHWRVPPTTGVIELWEKNCFAMKTNGIRWRSSKTDESSPWDLNSVYVSKEFKLPWWDPTWMPSRFA